MDQGTIPQTQGRKARDRMSRHRNCSSRGEEAHSTNAPALEAPHIGSCNDPVARYLGAIPHRLQLAGGWIDQPFVSRHNPEPPGSMVVVQLEPNFRPIDRSGI